MVTRMITMEVECPTINLGKSGTDFQVKISELYYDKIL